jgi:hypothetical protein
MRKFLTILCAMLLTVQFVAAQKNLYVLYKTGELTYYPATKVFFGNDLFVFTYGEVTNLTEESFVASFTVALNSSEVKSFKQDLEVGICLSDINTNPTIIDGKINKGTSLKDYTFKIYALDAGTTYYYRAYVKINGAVYYGDVCNVTTLGTKPNYITINGHKFVDLGLPSGLLWATCNIGAVVAADAGNYYAWGETTIKDTYDRSTYKYYDTSSSNFTKYNSTDGKTILENEDDVAYVNWGTSCRMPTQKDFKELIDNCIWNWRSVTTSSGGSVYGYKVFSVNGNSIFLPASGFRYESRLSNHGSGGYYWSSTLYSGSTSFPYYLYFYSGYFGSSNNNYHCFGLPVRPVAEQ